jgi:hypothetical protein
VEEGKEVKNYLSFGGGVNSVAMYLLLLEQGVEFEAVFVDHQTDWPETYEYFDVFVKKYPVTVLKPSVDGFDNLYDFCLSKPVIPSIMFRWCTDKFKATVMKKYYQKPAFNMMGIDAGESQRAKIGNVKGIENRFPLIEAGLNRNDCVKLIKRHGLSVPMKSGCYICPFQSASGWRELRRLHPDLFCKTQLLEKKVNDSRFSSGKSNLYFSRGPLSEAVDERQSKLWLVDEYPPCNCML